MMIYPSDARTAIFHQCLALIAGKRESISVTVGPEYDYAVKFLEANEVEFYDSLDTPVDVIIELA